MNLLRAPVRGDTAKVMGNGLYAILLGLAIRGILTDPDLEHWPGVLVSLQVALIFYYLLDWLSYNARVHLPTPLTHEELAGNVLSIIVFGAGLMFCLRLLEEGKLPSQSGWFVQAFQLFFLLYVLFTTIGLFWVSKAASFSESSFQKIDVGIRGLVCGVSAMLLCWTISGGEGAPKVATLLAVHIILACVLMGSKALRYVQVFLKELPPPPPAGAATAAVGPPPGPSDQPAPAEGVRA